MDAAAAPCGFLVLGGGTGCLGIEMWSNICVQASCNGGVKEKKRIGEGSRDYEIVMQCRRCFFFVSVLTD
jgi:hypothetical protein